MKYAVLHGARSGRRDNSPLVAHTLHSLREAGQHAEQLVAPDVASARAVCAQAVANAVDVLVVVGGDGAVRLAAQACAQSSTALAIVPAGSGNDTATSLGIPADARAAIALLSEGTRRRIDLIAARHDASPGPEEEPTFVVGSVPAALDALIAARSQRVPSLLGPARYAAATLAQIPRMSAADYQVSVEGHEFELRSLVLTVCNLPVFGGGMRIAPDADPTDGLLDVVSIGPVGPVAAVELLRRVFAGTHVEHPAVTVLRGSQVHLRGPQRTAYGDGDPVGPLPLTCAVQPASLDVVTGLGPLT